MEQLHKKLNVNVFVPKNNSLFISIIFVFLLFATIIYIKPSVFLFLFMSILGNFLLLLFVGLVGYFNVQWAIGLSAIFIILYQASHLSSGITREPFGVLDIEADTIYTRLITRILHLISIFYNSRLRLRRCNICWRIISGLGLMR